MVFLCGFTFSGCQSKRNIDDSQSMGMSQVNGSEEEVAEKIEIDYTQAQVVEEQSFEITLNNWEEVKFVHEYTSRSHRRRYKGIFGKVKPISFLP
jgi:hypothetical protein